MLGNVFDPRAELLVEERLRPHWSQAGAIVFVTMRLVDSIPREVLERWEREKVDWLRRRGQNGDDWIEMLAGLSAAEQDAFQREFQRCREDFLDSCHGRCLLRRPHLAQIVANALLHFDGDRYRLGDFIIMPNHAHVLAAFAAPEQMRRQFDSWLHYTAVQINKSIQSRGHVWQQEPFDHLVRSPEQYAYLREYIADNPVKAKLRPGEYLYRRYSG